MGRRTVGIALAVLALVAAQPVWADYQAGQQALDAGNVDEALTQWRVAANAGDRRAMLALGRLYLQGLSVLQNYVEAHKWLNLAASRGGTAALKERDALAAKMTKTQIATAQERAAAWRPSSDRTTGVPDAAVAQTTATRSGQNTGPDVGPPPPQAIREAQSLLATLGYRSGSADGIWGRRTGAAYAAFLRDAGLPAAQRLDAETLRVMRTLAKGADRVAPSDTTSTAARQQAAPPEAILEAQELLEELGYASGPADGRWRDSTAHAYRAFLRDAGLPVAEMLTPQALRAMRSLARAQSGRRAEQLSRQQAAMPPDALHRAAQAGDIESLKAALAAGVDVDARDRRSWTALMHAVNQGYTLLVPLLIEAEAAVDMRAADGATALFMAVVHGDPVSIQLLLEAGADLSVKGPQGSTVTELALVKGNSDVLKALGIAQVGETFSDCDECPRMVVVPAGSFTMGSPSSEYGHEKIEAPMRKVTIAESFAVGVYEVTFDEWDACVSAGGCRGYLPDDEGWGRDRRPVIHVSWDDAQEYVQWLNTTTGKAYRLLSESEWEYVTRAGTSGPFHTGSTISSDLANLDGKYFYGRRLRSDPHGIDRKQSIPVGSFPPNGFGLYDAHGNVREWVEDCVITRAVGYTGSPVDGSPWMSEDCTRHRLRGGDWLNSQRWSRSAQRHRGRRSDRNSWSGFRIARTLAP